MSYPKDSSRVNRFKINGRSFVLDVHSCIVTEIDHLAWDLIGQSTKVTNEEELFSALKSKYESKNITNAIKELKTMVSEGDLFSEDPWTNYKARMSSISTLCLNIAETCDLNCRYCFADGGTYGKKNGKMKPEVAKKAVDFIIENSGRLKDLTLCFFGGEPLLNFPVIQKTVEYSLRQGKEFGKNFRFNITTNGTKLTEDINKFLAKNNISIIFSIDGPKEIHDKMRPFRDGRGSYDIVSKNLKNLIKNSEKNGLSYSIRSTYTRQSYEISKIAMYLVDMGCYDISVEPAVLQHEELEIRAQDLPKIKEEYTRFAQLYINEIKRGRNFSFFHFRHGIDQTHRAIRNLTQCGAGTGYLAVSSDGKLYPCHRFVGNESFLIGDIYQGISRSDICYLFLSAHVNSKEKCLRCWARYICGGGCHAYAIEYNNDIREPFSVECELMKHRIKLGIYIYAELTDWSREALQQNYQQITQSRPYLDN